MTNKADSKPWNDECQSFLKSGSQGFVKDIAALEQHILKLQQLAARGDAGWVTLNAHQAHRPLSFHVSKLARLVKNGGATTEGSYH